MFRCSTLPAMVEDCVCGWSPYVLVAPGTDAPAGSRNHWTQPGMLPSLMICASRRPRDAGVVRSTMFTLAKIPSSASHGSQNADVASLLLLRDKTPTLRTVFLQHSVRRDIVCFTHLQWQGRPTWRSGWDATPYKGRCRPSCACATCSRPRCGICLSRWRACQWSSSRRLTSCRCHSCRGCPPRPHGSTCPSRAGHGQCKNHLTHRGSAEPGLGWHSRR